MAGTPLLFVEALHHAYGAKTVLRGVTLKVDDGETVAVIGPSGSGKSTLIRCINLLEAVREGRIMFEGRDVARPPVDARSVRQRIGMVFQNFELFPHLSVAENIMLAPICALRVPKAEARARAQTLLERVHIPEKAEAFPDELSGGQQQRVAIARALAMQPRLMLYDEPTSALDPEMIREVLDVIRELAEGGMTSILVTHEMAFARKVADRIVFMDQGEIVEVGEPEEFFVRPSQARTARFIEQILAH